MDVTGGHGSPLWEGREITAARTSAPGGAGHIGGYGIIQADDLDGGQALLDGHPHLMMPGASIQVNEFLDLPGM